MLAYGEKQLTYAGLLLLRSRVTSRPRCFSIVGAAQVSRRHCCVLASILLLCYVFLSKEKGAAEARQSSRRSKKQRG